MAVAVGGFDLAGPRRVPEHTVRCLPNFVLCQSRGHVGVTQLAPNPLSLPPRPRRALAPTELHAPRRPKRPLQPGARTSPLQMLPDAVAGDWQVVASRVDVLILAVDPEWGERVSGDVG